MKTEGDDVNLKDFVFVLVRQKDIPLYSEEARKIEEVTGQVVVENETVRMFHHGKSLMAKRGYVLDGMAANDTMVAYAGRLEELKQGKNSNEDKIIR